ncbi:MAG: hypothetical protein SCK57_12915, partial [Bacillota bacterium]|nr:hypothetical protein [Bacillota bacterium]
MRMTRREKLLLAVLLFSVLFFASYRFLVVDQLADISEAEMTLAELQERISQLETLEETSRRLDEDIELVKANQAGVRSEFLSLIDEQEEIILLLNEFLLNPNVNATSLSFTPPGTETVDDTELYSMDVTMAYQSNYPALLNFFRSIWNYERKIIINQLAMNGTDAQQLSGNFQIRFYDLAQVTGDLDRLFTWLLTIQEMRENPFTGAGP